MAMRPTFRNLSDSFEGWMYRNGLQRQLTMLERGMLVESKQDSNGKRVHRLTKAGRIVALGERDPVARWNRTWDHKWRIVLFDIPQSRANERTRLRRSLSARWFGYLQNSVWISPDPLAGERKALGNAEVDVESLILLEARPCAGETDAEIVDGAWNFEVINQHYQHHAEVLDRMPREPVAEGRYAKKWGRWLREEGAAWDAAMRSDPLLPTCLHPSDYLGVRAWNRRLQVMRQAGRRLRTFRQMESHR
jgi:phenylacetic acid degradation operon negative regulatory protein